ncbi:hypothetical protein [uncultured Tenacibaculum sp.]|uniref:hypothetical protein n=1 Tax=uncultured Tenacibaculum sp. TaxID=174713 RepID=UPI0026361862|nr:hypothetical protein [uncultured Tenacibaculum sp.]
MEIKNQTILNIPAGWVGGFASSNPEFAYPNPNLTSLPMPDNMLNIGRLQRQQAVKWPEFSWETKMGAADPKRCYQMFAPDISRIGYTNEGRVYSIICPQQGITSPLFGSLNVEVTVTGTRGWVNEDNRELAAEMGVVGKIWFSPPKSKEGWIVSGIQKLLWDKLQDARFPFPFTKSQAIMVTTHKNGDPDQPVFPVRKGVSTGFPIPDFAKHEAEAWTVGNLEVQIGPIVKTGYPIVDEFNALVMDVFNLGSGNMLQEKNVLTWNVWFTEPELVNQNEWASHAWRWRQSIDTDHGSPDGPGTEARYYDGTPFSVDFDLIKKQEESKLMSFLEHFDSQEKDKILKAVESI